MRDELNRWMKRFPPMGKHAYSDKVELARMEKHMEEAELKSLDVSEDDVEKGTVQWHILNLCRVLDYLGVGTIEYDYTVSILEDRLKEYEAGLKE